MNTIRHLDYFNPNHIKTVHIIGVGAVGSHIANNLARLGIKEIHLWDIDIVEDHNIPNQMFLNEDLGKLKTLSVAKYLTQINPDIKLYIHEKYTNEELEGYVFACVDNIEVRKELYLSNQFNINIKAMFDTRVALTDGQVLSADWTKLKQIKQLIEASDFKHEEVEEVKSACGSKLAVIPTIQFAATIATSIFINFINTKELPTVVLYDAFDLYIKKL